MTHWAVPQTALTGESLTGGPVPANGGQPASGTPATSAVFDYGRVMSQHALQVAFSDFSGVGVAVADLLGSLDGVSWYTLINIAPNDLGGGDPPSMVDTVSVQTTATPARFVQVRAFAITWIGATSVSTVTVSAVTVASED